MSENDLAEYLRRRMRESDISQVSLARRAGISRQGLVKLLNGEVRGPSTETVRAIASALRVSPIYLLRLLFGKSVIDAEIAAASAVPGDHSSFVGDVTIPNGTMIPAGGRFEKIWEIQNGGAVRWKGRSLECMDEPLAPGLTKEALARVCLTPDATKVPIRDAAPGDVIRLSMWFTAPIFPATCASIWKMVDADGKPCFPKLPGLDVVVVVTAV